jgi:predicted GTPase
VIIGTPIDLRRIIDIKKPSARVQYSLEENTRPDLSEVLHKFLHRMRARSVHRK